MIRILLVYSLVLIGFSSVAVNDESNKFPFSLPELPYKENALEPYISARTFSYHYNKHHNAYFVNLNKLVANTELSTKALEELIMLSYNDPAKSGIFNNAGQAWNHSFFWRSMKANGGGKPYGKIAVKIDQDFGSYRRSCSRTRHC